METDTIQTTSVKESEINNTERAKTKSFYPKKHKEYKPKQNPKTEDLVETDPNFQEKKPKNQKPRTPKSAAVAIPKADEPIDFNSLDFDDEPRQYRTPMKTPFGSYPPPHRPVQSPRELPDTEETGTTESAKKKRYRPRHKNKQNQTPNHNNTNEIAISHPQVAQFLNSGNAPSNTSNAAHNINNNNNNAGNTSSPARVSISLFQVVQNQRNNQNNTPNAKPSRSNHGTPQHPKQDQRHVGFSPVTKGAAIPFDYEASSYPPTRYNDFRTPNKTPKSGQKPHKTLVVGPDGQPVSDKKKRNRRKSGAGKEPKEETPQHNLGKTPPSNKSNKQRDRFEPHLSNEQINEGLKNGTLYKGNLRVNAKNPRESYVTAEGLSKDVYIEGVIHRNRAYEGDIVIVQLFEKSKWKKLKTINEEEDLEDEQLVVKELVEDLFDDTEPKGPAKKLFDKKSSIDSEDESDEDSDDNEIEKVNNKLSDLKIDEKKTPQKAVKEEELQPSGKIVAILESKHNNEQIGYVRSMNDGGVKDDDRFACFFPIDIRAPRVLVPITQIPDFSKDPSSFAEKLVRVETVNWRPSSYLPLGKYKGILGQSGEIEPETEAILIQHKVDASEFPADVVQALPSKDWRVPQQEINKRRDLRNHRIFTIDPATAKDLDDALHITKLPDGTYEVGVHIADVSHFVKPDTKLDDIAKGRSTTVYLVQKAIPMLPRVLCENLCSLDPDVDRLAFSVIWRMTSQGEILEEWFGRTVIRSCSKMCYDVAQLMIEGKIKTSWKDNDLNVDSIYKSLGPYGNHSISDITQDVLEMNRIAQIMRKKRFDNGALSMNNVKLAFKLDEKGNPISYYQYITKEANHMIEEYMLLANQQVAKRISTYFPEAALLRNHVNPLLRKLETFVKFCSKHISNSSVNISSAKSLGQSLEELKRTQSPHIFYALQLLATRAMQLAKYFCTGDMDNDDGWKHYALNVDRYTHFTSPIRRYPDILVHRLLWASLLQDNGNLEDSKSDFRGLPERSEISLASANANDKKLNSRKAQEDSAKLFLCVLLKNRPVVEDAVVLSIGDKYITFILPTFGIEKRVYMEDMSLNSSECKDPELKLLWPTTIRDKTESSIEQVVKNLSIIKLRVSTKLVRSRPDLDVYMLHPQEIEDYEKLGKIPSYGLTAPADLEAHFEKAYSMEYEEAND